ncbi:TM helix repeat-containing protein [Moraxella macacae 0408225]|uniref:Small-conductance mechanosensitive channel n=1 Tax=Moraxella macacae 0408225 TaxID=1230338 RepID=L2FA04_9GAMM|nr:mechanosensitive ion channel [Moraxella macacae]ELA09566.1 TM helix repeat-containing protein [Moraxella macacae 0408225]
MDSFFINFNQTLGSSVVTMIGALVIFLIGWILAGIIGSAIHKLLAKINLNQKMNSSTGKTYDIARLLSRITFWFVFVIGISAALSFLRLDAISVPFANMINQVLLFIPNLIGALALAVLGFVIATIARTALTATLNRTTLDEKLAQEVGVQPIGDNIANIAYWFILLMFLPMVLQQLGLTGLLAPVNNMIGKTLDFVPNIVVAGVLFFVGLVIAKILRGIVSNVVASLNIQALTDKAGISNKMQLSNMAGGFVYLLVMITTIIMALDALKIESVSRPATNMLNQIMAAIPNIIAAVAILGLTYYTMKFVANIVKNLLDNNLLDNTDINDLPTKLGLQNVLNNHTTSNHAPIIEPNPNIGTKNHKVSDIISGLIVFFAMLFAAIEASNLLGFNHISNLITMFIEFGAQILLGAVVLAIGFWLANLLAGMVQRSPSGSTFLANLVRVLIMGLVLAMGLRAMGIADSIVNLAFGLTLGSVAVAFALAFGLGGREAAARLLKNMQDKAEAETEAKNRLKPTGSFSSDDLKPKF